MSTEVSRCLAACLGSFNQGGSGLSHLARHTRCRIWKLVRGLLHSIPLPHIWSFKTRQTVLQPRPRPFSIARPFYKLQQEPCSQRPSLKPIAVWSHFAAGRLPQHQLQRMPLASVEAGTSSTCFMSLKKKDPIIGLIKRVLAISNHSLTQMFTSTTS